MVQNVTIIYNQLNTDTKNDSGSKILKKMQILYLICQDSLKINPLKEEDEKEKNKQLQAKAWWHSQH